MVVFTLEWETDDIVNNTNVTGQTASYRLESTAPNGGWTPILPNPLGKTIETVDTPALLDNITYQFKVEAICTLNGPTINDNGIQEEIGFACITPVITKTTTTSTISIDVTGLSITKAGFELLKQSTPNPPVVPLTVMDRVGNTIGMTASTLISATAYFWKVRLYANVNDELVNSFDYMGACPTYPFTTDSFIGCIGITAATVTATSV